MYAILFFLLFCLIGYWLAASRFSRPIDRTASTIAAKPRLWYDRIRGRRNKSLPSGAEAPPFILWATGEGARYFPDEFRNWLASLPPEEASRLVLAMDEYAQNLGFRLDDLAQESLQSQRALMQVYVEALTIYSQAYRKAKQANQPTEKTETESPASTPKGPKTNGKNDGRSNRETAKAADSVLSPAS